MACSVFGTLITDETLKGMTKYHDNKSITRLDKATVAFEMKNAEGKDINAHKYLEEVRSTHHCDGIKVLLYNATGGPVKLVSYCFNDGCVGPSPIPMIISNGQWGAYFHPVDPKEYGRNTAGHAVVYEGANASGSHQQWMFAMEAKWPGRCFNEIKPGGYYSQTNHNFGHHNDDLAKELYTNEVESYGCYSFASIGGDTSSPFFEGLMTVDGTFGY